ncbi:MAG: hypothetical protein K8H85_07385 [Cyclobacteriaceae bacterium]|nr:hypothetical protein [Cyclobacteriaceae bacterium]
MHCTLVGHRVRVARPCTSGCQANSYYCRPIHFTLSVPLLLLVGHRVRVARVDIPNKKVTNLTVPEGEKISRRESIDGLSYYKWSLVGVQPDMKTISRYYLNEKGDGIKEVKVLEKNHPMMDHPTTGVLVDNEFYYIANSQFEKISEEGVLSPMQQLYEPVILKVKID